MPQKRSNSVDVSCEQSSISSAVDPRFVRNFVLSVLDSLNIKNSTLSVSFVTDEVIRELNRDYRDKDEATDILSFAQCDGVPFPSKKKVLGDMVISLDSMKRNCEIFNVPEEEELKRLLIHGCLHLSGQDHATNDISSEPMLQLQERILSELNQ